MRNERTCSWIILATAISLWMTPLLPAGAPMAFPGSDWEEASPESQGVDPARLRGALEGLEKRAGRDGLQEFILVRNGRAIRKGPAAGRVHGIWSCTKSFTSTVFGLLIDDGKTSLEARAAERVPALAAAYQGIALRHFTTMTSGYRAEGDEPKGSYAHGPSDTPFSPSGSPLFAPGTRYAYWDSAMNEFGLVLTRIAGEPMEDLFRRRIADPIGMDPKEWDWGDFGPIDGIVTNGGAGNHDRHVRISARQLARLGHLFLNRGEWAGRRLIAASWIDAATSVQVPADLPIGHPSSADGRGVYGFNWWRNGTGADGKRKWPGAPAGTYAALGYNDNALFVVPEWCLVVARLGLDGAGGAIRDDAWSDFFRAIGEAIGAAPSGQAEQAAPELSAEAAKDEIIVKIGSEEFTRYRHGATEKNPFLLPVIGPRSGKSVTTAFEQNYPHHRSVFFGCDRVNGGNYWQEGLERGRIASTGPKVVRARGTSVEIEDRCRWERPGAPAVIEDRRRITFSAPSKDLRLIEFDVTMTALVDVRVSKTNHSLFAVRAAKDLTPSGGGELVNSSGEKGEKATFGKKARWCDFSGERGGVREGIAILDHPGNPWSPCQWFTRDYGFISPTPMNWLDEWRLEKGKSVRLRYLVAVHAGDAAAAGLEDLWKKWTSKKEEGTKAPAGDRR